MTHLLTNLSNTIQKEFIIPVISRELEFRENNSPCNKVILKSSRNQIFAFSLDKSLGKNCKIFPFFCNTATLNKVNDGIVFCINNNEIFVLLIELKTANLGDYKKQLQAGKLFILFLEGILNNSFSSKYKIKEENIKCLVFSLRKTERKQATSRTKITYQNINGLNIAELQCNDNHIIEKFI
jgi:tyrosine-protein phosphatase YwqE